MSAPEATPDEQADGEDAAAALADARALLADLPRMHHWGGEDQVGGLNSVIGERMITELDRYRRPRVVETGAGATTLLFCCLRAGELTSIAPSEELGDRIRTEAAERAIGLEPLRYLCERSEIALPRLAADGERFEVGLIDGSHNWPSVFVDFCYINVMLPAGGTLFVDDVHLYSVLQLFLLLRGQDQFEYVALDNKLATFRKLVDDPFLPEWTWQPHITKNMARPPQ